MGSANGFIASYTISPRLRTKELPQRWPSGEPLSSGNLFQESLVSQPWRQPFDKSFTPEQHLASDVFLWRALSNAFRHKRLVLPLSDCTLLIKLSQ